jgi:hypothetical protein
MVEARKAQVELRKVLSGSDRKKAGRGWSDCVLGVNRRNGRFKLF